MAKKRKAPAPPRRPPAKAQFEEPLKPKEEHDNSSSEEESEEVEEEGEEESEEEEEESEEEEDDDDESEEVVEEEEEGEEEEEEEEEEEKEEEENEPKAETLRKLLEPFGKDQIIDFLKEAALKDRSVIDRITQSAESDPAHRKIFVHGLGWDATTDHVLSVFKQYGDIEECKVVADKVTGRAKGYGFVLFRTRRGARKALKQPQKKIGNRTTSCQLASAGPVPSHPVTDVSSRKIYVANVAPHVNPDKLRAFFAKFGEIEEGPLGGNPATGRLKGFAIFVYKTGEGCKKALGEPVKVFEGCQLQCRRAMGAHRTNKTQTSVSGASGSSRGGATIQQSDVTTMNYGVGVNPGIIGHNVNPAAMLIGQSPGIGLTNPVLASALSQTGYSPSVAAGLPPSIGATPQLGFSGNYGVNSISPSMIGSYGSQAAFQGLGAYQNPQLGHSSTGVTSMAATRPQSGFGSVGNTFPSYIAR